jgi:hypothetical protein
MTSVEFVCVELAAGHLGFAQTSVVDLVAQLAEPHFFRLALQRVFSFGTGNRYAGAGEYEVHLRYAYNVIKKKTDIEQLQTNYKFVESSIVL